MARQLAEKLSDFEPKRVLYIEQGGTAIGQEVARMMGLPCLGLDIRYPLSRVRWRPLRRLLWPVKELIYRCTSPSLGRSIDAFPRDEHIALVDDSSNSGRTIRAALAALEALEIDVSLIRVAVVRCGKRARSKVDHFVTGEALLFWPYRSEGSAVRGATKVNAVIPSCSPMSTRATSGSSAKPTA